MSYLRLLIAAGPVIAGTYSDGVAAYDRQDYKTALRVWQPLAQSGYALAQLNLSNMYAKGKGVPKDAQQAVFWYGKAADQGDAKAQFNLGNMYAKGKGVPKYDQLAYFWLLLASVGSDADAVKNRNIVEKRLTLQQRASAQAGAHDWKPTKQ